MLKKSIVALILVSISFLWGFNCPRFSVNLLNNSGVAHTKSELVKVWKLEDG